jgi:FkbM family methyltransferase
VSALDRLRELRLLSRAFDVLPDALVFRGIAWQHRLFEQELNRLAEIFPRGDTAVDVGAWWGPWTYWLARRAVRVVTIEPVPYLAEFLRGVVPPNVEVINAALSDRSGQAELWIPTAGKGSEGRSSLESSITTDARLPVRVRTRLLDELSLEDVSFVKIDVEGHELPVLRGAEGTITRWRPTIVIEVEERGGESVAPVFHQIRKWGYAGRFLDRGVWRPLEEFDVMEHQLRHRADVERRGYLANAFGVGRTYVNNFVFIPDEKE